MNRYSVDYTKEWDLKTIGAYCAKLNQRTAADAWLMGRLLLLAKEKASQERTFTKWKREHKFSDATVSRHIRLFKHFPSEEDRERLCTIGIMEGLREAGVAARGAKASAKTSTGAASTSQHVTFPWAVEDGPEAERCRAEMDREYRDYSEKQWAKSGSLKEVCRKEIPWQMDNLRQSAKLALERESEIQSAWPEDRAERTKLLLIINELLKWLPRLAESLADRKLAEKRRVTKRRKPAKKKNVAT